FVASVRRVGVVVNRAVAQDDRDRFLSPGEEKLAARGIELSADKDVVGNHDNGNFFYHGPGGNRLPGEYPSAFALDSFDIDQFRMLHGMLLSLLTRSRFDIFLVDGSKGSIAFNPKRVRA